MKVLPSCGSLLWLRIHSFLFDLYDLVEPLICDGSQFRSLTFVGNRIRLTPVEQTQIRHCIIIICAQLYRVFQRLDPLSDHSAILLPVLFTKASRE